MYKTDQEKLWAGEFGDLYNKRKNTDQILYSKVAVLSKMLKSTNNIKSIRELGCNIGLNLVALKRLNPDLSLYGYEINEEAVHKANKYDVATITKCSILENINDELVDLTFTMGVLIHINPNFLSNVYDNLVNGSNRYILICEYYNPKPTQIDNYRGHNGMLFKRDWAGELIDKYNLKLIDYGFIYKRDNWYPQDDVNWFLLEK